MVGLPKPIEVIEARVRLWMLSLLGMNDTRKSPAPNRRDAFTCEMASVVSLVLRTP